MKPKCGDCRFFTQPGAVGDLYGVCVRFPQQQHKHAENDWCGEFIAIKTDVPLREPAKPNKQKS